MRVAESGRAPRDERGGRYVREKTSETVRIYFDDDTRLFGKSTLSTPL